ncbi:unnamed protein product [Heligmosomoides polygyrus]|uniref:7TM_GPCR_Srx domain-containing protein n=1 Tax=Heligmosomoides polygyrus TaxID=6339 RepID=A0A183FKS4_HELPZ|nr:unnamed protein product [Heligmosomoides polygyrus]
MESSRDCSPYEPFITFWPLHVVLFLQVVCGVVSAMLSVYALMQCQNLYFHVNCKILICGQIVIFVIHSAFIVSIQVAIFKCQQL